jgi:hypothetical protein
VAVFPVDGPDGVRILKAADNALYQAKHEGRDRICRAVAQNLDDDIMQTPAFVGEEGEAPPAGPNSSGL